MRRTRTNPLALAVLVCLTQKPMHPYEVATTLRQREKHRSVRLNFGALYPVVESLAKRGLIAAKETERRGRLPERTIYQLTNAGRLEVHDWLADLVSTPAEEYPQFVTALAFLSTLEPGRVVELLNERLRHLSVEEAQSAAFRELVQKAGLPRLLWIEDEYRDTIRGAEINYVRSLISDIEASALEGSAWWRDAHRVGFDSVSSPLKHDEENDD